MPVYPGFGRMKIVSRERERGLERVSHVAVQNFFNLITNACRVNKLLVSTHRSTCRVYEIVKAQKRFLGQRVLGP